MRKLLLSREYILPGSWLIGLTEVSFNVNFTGDIPVPRYLNIVASVCNPQYIANEQRQILRRIPVIHGEAHVHHTFGAPYYIGVSEKHFKDIQFKILNDNWELSGLNSELSLVLHITRNV